MTDQFTFKYWNENHLNALMALEIATGLAGPRVETYSTNGS